MKLSLDGIGLVDQWASEQVRNAVRLDRPANRNLHELDHLVGTSWSGCGDVGYKQRTLTAGECTLADHYLFRLESCSGRLAFTKQPSRRPLAPIRRRVSALLGKSRP